MTVRLKVQYGKYPPNTNLTTGADEEARLLREGLADTNTSAGVAYTAPSLIERSGPPSVVTTDGVDALVADGRVLSLGAVSGAGNEAALVALAAQGGQYIRLTADITLTGTVVVEDGTTIDLNGYTLRLANGVNKSLITNSRWGVPPTSVTVTSVGLTATAVFASAHGLSADDVFPVLGADQQAYNGVWRVATVVNSTTVTYQLKEPASAATATGSITSGRANKNLVVVGGAIDMNESNQTATGSVDTMSVRFMNALGVKFDRLNMRNAKKYCLLAANCDEISVPYVNFDTASDGLHLNGPIGTASIGTLEGKTGDDLFALTCGDYVTYAPCLGDIRNVTVDALKPRYSLNAFKIAGLPGTKVHYCRINSISGMTRRQAVYCTNDTNLTSTNCDYLEIGSIRVLHGQETANTYPLIQMRGAVSGDAFYGQVKIGAVHDLQASDTADLITLADAVFGRFEIGSWYSRNIGAKKHINIGGQFAFTKWLKVAGIDITPGNSASAIGINLSATKGTGAGYLVNNAAGYPVGATAIAADTGTGTIAAGELIQFGTDPNVYTVATALSAGSLTLRAPGLRQAVADNAAITVVTGTVRLLETQGEVAADGGNTNAKFIFSTGTGVTYGQVRYNGLNLTGCNSGFEQNVTAAPPPNLWLGGGSKWTGYNVGISLRDTGTIVLDNMDPGTAVTRFIQLASATAGVCTVRGSVANKPASRLVNKAGGTWTLRMSGHTLYQDLTATHTVDGQTGDMVTDTADNKVKMFDGAAWTAVA